MQFFDQFLLLLSPQHILLVKILLGLMFALHLPFIAMLFGGSLFSLIFRLLSNNEEEGKYSKFSRDLINTFAPNISIALLLGFLPLIVIALLYSQILFEAKATTLLYLLISFLPIIIGMIILYIYKTAIEKSHVIITLTGALGVILLLAGYLLFITSIARLHDPEKWAFIQHPPDLLFGWNAIANVKTFFTMAIALTGTGILFFFFRWSGKLENESREYQDYVRKFASIIGLISTLLAPLFFIWQLVTLPDISYSFGLLGLAIIFILILGLVVYYLSKTLEISTPKFVTRTFLLMITAFMVMIFSNSLSMENALKEQNMLLREKSEAMLAELLPEREFEEGGGLADYAKGEDIYKRVCSSCHRFDKKIVGPPYTTVMSKYEDDVANLVQFIKNPQKMDPEYPPMANLGLKISEAEAVAGYLVKTYQEEYK